MTILKIHGCSGAGKTTTARTLLSHAAAVHKGINHRGRDYAYKLEIPQIHLPVYLLGDYSANCGGVDTIDDYREVIRLIDKFYPHGHVVFEGLLLSTYYGAMGQHSKIYNKDYVYAFLDTPKAVCLGRVAQRRQDNGTTTKWDPRITEEKYHNIWRLHKKLTDGGIHRVELIEYDKPAFPQLVEMLNYVVP